ncbi:hypothetical protein Hanom_Chr07g00642541 [Helianthus anomalus]
MHDNMSVGGVTGFNSPVVGVNEGAENEEVEDGEIIKSPREKADRLLNLAADFSHSADPRIVSAHVQAVEKDFNLGKFPMHEENYDWSGGVPEVVGGNIQEVNKRQVIDFQDGPGPNNTRPSYITCRPKRDKKHGKKPKKKAQNFIIPDLNQEPEITNTSDPFNLEEIFRMEEVNRMREFVPSWSMHREESEEIAGEEQVRLNFEDEVSRTLEFGACLGIGVEGFENHVKKLVQGEMEFNRGR